MSSGAVRLRRAARSGVPLWCDVAAAIGLAACAVIDVIALGLTPELTSHRAAAVPFALLTPVFLAARRRHTAVAAVGAAVVVAVQGVVVAPVTSLAQVVTILLLVVALGEHARIRPGVAALAACALSIGFIAIKAHSSVSGIVSIAPFLTVPFLAGLAVRASRQHARRLQALTVELAAERQRSAELAVAEERTRIARDLHDLVSHGVGVMAVQAGGARRVLHTDLPRVRQALEAIETTGRTALAELGLMVRLLRADGQSATCDSLPTLDDLNPLVDRPRFGGADVSISLDSACLDVAAPVQLAAYRLVQEAATNAVKHAPGSPVRIELRRQSADLLIEVVNRSAQVASAATGGHGLIGMRERAALFGGTLTAGPERADTWAVRARLPLESP